MNNFYLKLSLLFLALSFYSCETKQEISTNRTIQNKKFRDTIFNQTPLVLWYTEPALQNDTTPYANGNTTHIHGNPDQKGWDEALPIGNGRLTAMVFGGIKRERIQLNEETLWSGKKVDFQNNDSYNSLEEVRKLIFEGKYYEAQILAEQTLTGLPNNISTFKPFCDIFIDFPKIKKEKEVEHYYRDLHIDSSIATVHYEYEGVLYTREVLASYPDNIIVMRITANVPNSINAIVSITRETESETVRSPYDSTLIMLRGKLEDNGLLFESQVKAVYSGGTVRNGTRKLICENVDTLTLYISAATANTDPNYAYYAKQQILKAIKKPYSKLKADHIADYKALFDRVAFNLTSADKAYDVPTDERISRIRKGNNDKYLTELMFQYGRYLLISSSREGNWPINMQGKWNEHNNPLYGSGYRIEWTLPLAYSLADVTNLQDLRSPFLKLLDSSKVHGKYAANKMYKVSGYVAHDYLSIYGNNFPTTHELISIPPMGGAWLFTSLYDNYRFHANKDWLKNQLYPLLKDASIFMLNFLVKAPSGPYAGKLVVCPSLSEENEFELKDGSKAKLSYGSAMDQQLVYELFQCTISAIDELSDKKIKFEPNFRQKLTEALKNLAMAPIEPETNEIQEWLEDYNVSNTPKNYISQLYGLYPAAQITKTKTPELYKAAEITLNNEIKNLKKSSHGNALAAIWYARLHKPNQALKYLNKQIAESTSPNLLSNNPPFYIDGNMIYTAAVAEMLIQSHDGFIEFLPAEPVALGEGYAKGLCARGGFECDIAWKDSKISVQITSNEGNQCTIKIDSEPKIYSDNPNFKVKNLGNGLYTFNTDKGGIYTLEYSGRLNSEKEDNPENSKNWLGIDLGLNLGIKF